MAFLEIQEGPYLVKPSEEAFDRGERPINVDASNIVWLTAATTNWIEARKDITNPSKGPELTFLWGQPHNDQDVGSLIRLPAGFSGSIQSKSSEFRAVIIDGKTKVQLAGETDTRTLTPGSYFGSTGEATHQISSTDGDGCVIYVRNKGMFKVTPAPSSK